MVDAPVFEITDARYERGRRRIVFEAETGGESVAGVISSRLDSFHSGLTHGGMESLADALVGTSVVARPDGPAPLVTYETRVECGLCGAVTGFVHEGPWTPPEQEGPWPDAVVCPRCGHRYPDDLGSAVVEDAVVRRVENPEDPPEEHRT